MEEVHRTIGSSQLHHEFSPDYRGILNSNIKCARLLKEFSVDDDRPVVFFLHGYNTSFEQALHQTRKLSAEIGGSVTLALWSWASLGLKSGYLADLDHIQLGMHSATRFLNSLTPDVRVGQFQVLSHSMGGNLAMHFASEAKKNGLQLSNLIFVAADIERRKFIRAHRDGIFGSAHRTIYAADDDIALQVSRSVRPNSPPRVGHGGNEILVLSGLDSIDTSMVTTGFSLRHSHAFDIKEAFEDLRLLLVDHKQAHERNLKKQIKNVLPYWIILSK
jgi:esterase/lipase superfamily enzyme